MIPRRVEVEGFLCYRDRQVVDLEGSDLWVFAGRNGSGKSSIFDAIALALYGRHRGGEQGKEYLINVEAAEYRVAFEFDLGPDRFRITRALRRGGRSDRQVHRHEVDEQGEEHWYPVAETDKEDGIKRWIEGNIGLNYEMFTCSMLLRQGHADKLLEAPPKQRFEIVAEVADLKSYQSLHKKAEARSLVHKDRLEEVRSSLAGRPVVEPAAVEEAEDRLAGAEDARALALGDRDRLAGMEIQARLWGELVEGRAKSLAEAERARQVILASETIKADWDRLRELDGVLPALLEESVRRAEAGGREAAVSDRGATRQAVVRRLDGLSALDEQSRAWLAKIVGEIAEDESRRSAILDQQSALLEPIQRARLAGVHRDTVATLKAALAAHPADPEGDADRLADEAARHAEWRAALPTLENLAAARDGLGRARAEVEAGGAAVAAADARARLAGDALGVTRSEASEARILREEAGRRSTEAGVVLRSALGRLEAFEGLEGSPACDRCGQPLTPGHHAIEARRLRDEHDEALFLCEEAGRALREAEDRARSAEAAAASADREGREADAARADARRELVQAEVDAARHETACVKAFGDLDESFSEAVSSGPVADWSATTFPTPADLAEGRRLRLGQPEADRLSREARARLDAIRVERSRLEEARRALGAIGLLPGDDHAEGEHARLADAVASLDRCLETRRLEKASAEGDADDLARKLDDARAEIVAIDARQETDRALIHASREASSRARPLIPESWVAAFDGATREEVDAWEGERRSLHARGIREIAAELPHAHWTLNAAENEIASADARLAKIPEEARRDAAEVARVKVRAVAVLTSAEEEARTRRRELDDLRRVVLERAELSARLMAADRALAVSARLAELLGRGSLQRALIRDAERGILDCANPILRHISGDDLELRLAAEEPGDEKALPLEVVDRTHGAGRAIGVAFLSGSQRFRVAVSLALGIGQYARGLDRPIRSVIIDEGFGSLDRQGRDEMIAQLSALKGRLDRIILVSHQEEFAEAFKDGFHFEARDGSTVIREFHR